METPHYYAIPSGNFTEAVGEFPYWRGAALKYVWRAGRKPGADEQDDLRKAIDCLQRELERLEWADD